MIELNQEFIKKVTHCVMTTANAIASDLQEAYEYGDDTLDNYALIESCMDGHYKTFGGDKEASMLLEEAFNEHGFVTVCEFLDKHISII